MAIHPDTQAALESGNYAYNVGLVTLDFTHSGGAPALFATSQFDVADPGTGKVYPGSGLVVTVGSVNETSELRAEPLSFEFVDADTTVSALVLQYEYIGAPVEYSRALLDDHYQVIGAPIVYFVGTVAGVGGNEDQGEARTLIDCHSHWANFDAVNGRRVNPKTQEEYFPNDKGFEFSGESLRDLRWGRKD